jgi:DNA-binding beta-propeller fold protein YncE
MFWITSLSTAALVALGAVGCGSTDIASPIENAHGVAIAPGDGGRALIVNLVGSVAAEVALGTRASLASVIAQRTLYLGVLFADGRRELLAIDLPSATLRWREPTSGQTQRRIIGNVEIWAPDVMTATPSGDALVLSFARQNGRGGIASLDVATRRIANFAPFVPRAGLSTVAAGAFFPTGAIVLGGSRDSATIANDVYFLDPATLTAVDSIAASAFGGRSDRLQQVVPTRDGSVLYLNTQRKIVRFDVRSRTATASVGRPIDGSLALSADEQSLILPDAGRGPNDPGTGTVRVYDARTLQPTGTITLPSSAGGGPRVSVAAAAGLDPGVMYLTTGTARIGPNYPVDPAALVELDLVAMSVRRVTPLNDWAVGKPFPF